MWKTAMEEFYFLGCNFTKSNTLSWMFFTFFKLYKWYQIAQSIAIIENFSSKMEQPI